MNYSPRKIEDVSAASAAMFVNLHLATLRAASPPEAFLLLQRFIAQAVFCYVEACANWGLSLEPSEN